MTIRLHHWLLALAGSLLVHSALAAVFNPPETLRMSGGAGELASAVIATGSIATLAGLLDAVEAASEPIAPVLEPLPVEALTNSGMAPSAIAADAVPTSVETTAVRSSDSIDAAPRETVVASAATALSSTSTPVVAAVDDGRGDGWPPIPVARPWREIDENRRVAEAARQAELAAARRAERARQREARERQEQRAAQRETNTQRQQQTEVASRGNARETTPAGGRATARANEDSGHGRNSGGGSFNLSNYSGRVMAHLQRHKRYPRSAQNAGMEGSAVVRFTINASGTVTGAVIVSSSGHSALDQETLAMVRRASRFPAIPSEAGRGSMTFTAPVTYRLN